jgi:hypothetical protein
MGLFSGKGSLGPGRHRAFAVTSESRASDILLRFFYSCENCWEIDNKLANNFPTTLYVKDKFELKIHENTHQCGK